MTRRIAWQQSPLSLRPVPLSPPSPLPNDALSGILMRACQVAFSKSFKLSVIEVCRCRRRRRGRRRRMVFVRREVGRT